MKGRNTVESKHENDQCARFKTDIFCRLNFNTQELLGKGVIRVDITIYTSTGCTRCKIVKKYMDEASISYVEADMKGEGKEDFQGFYKVNRNSVYRGPDGIEFPIITDQKEIRQGIGSAIAYLHGGVRLDGYFSVGTLHKEWVDGIHISQGNSLYIEDFIQVLKTLKSKNMKLQLDTNGVNSCVLKRVLDEKLADVVIMNVLGPKELYPKILGKDIDLNDIETSISIVPQFPGYKFQTSIVPLKRGNENVSYITTDELGEIARFIKESTGSNKIKLFIRPTNPRDLKGEFIQSLEPLAESQLLAYRTKARTHLVYSEIENNLNR